MLLTIDVGNTQTVLGMYGDDDLICMWRIATDKTDTPDELRLKLLPLMAADSLEPSQVDGVAIASVVPVLSRAWQRAIQAIFRCDPLFCTAQSAGSLFRAAYDNPAEIGADRVADAVAARHFYGAPVLVVDFGTATNVEVIDREGRFTGGVIAPGLETSATALFSHATKLPAIDLLDPGSIIGKNTVHAMQAGIVYGEADRIDGFVHRIFSELHYEAPVVATGGLATTIAPLCRTAMTVNPQLTLEGLRLIYGAQRG